MPLSKKLKIFFTEKQLRAIVDELKEHAPSYRAIQTRNALNHANHLDSIVTSLKLQFAKNTGVKYEDKCQRSLKERYSNK